MTLPEWLDPIYSPDEMRAADRYAIEQHGILELELAEKAGAGLASAVEDLAESGPIRIVVGPGNNGGDGMIAARLLRIAGYRVDVLAPIPLEGLQGVPRVSLDRLPGAPPRPFEAALLEGSGAIVDALLGTGFEGAVGEPLDRVITAINAQDAPVIAADVPSGVNASTGAVEGVAVVANATTTNHAPKIGLCVSPGTRHAGTVRVVGIGIPPGDPGASHVGLTNRRVLAMIPARSGKGPGHDAVVVAGGTRDAADSVSVAALAAVHAVAGSVRVVVPASAVDAIDPRLRENVVRALPEDPGGRPIERNAEIVVQAAKRDETIVLGSGAADGDTEVAFLRAIGRAHAGPLVVAPAGGSEEVLDELAERPGPTVLVGGPWELAPLLGKEPAWATEHRLEFARSLAERSTTTVVLAGDNPIVVSPGGPCAVGPGDAGSLDGAEVRSVLVGLVGALLSRGMDPFAGAAAGVFALTRAGAPEARDPHESSRATASNIIAALPQLG